MNDLEKERNNHLNHIISEAEHLGINAKNLLILTENIIEKIKFEMPYGDQLKVSLNLNRTPYFHPETQAVLRVNIMYDYFLARKISEEYEEFKNLKHPKTNELFWGLVATVAQHFKEPVEYNELMKRLSYFSKHSEWKIKKLIPLSSPIIEMYGCPKKYQDLIKEAGRKQGMSDFQFHQGCYFPDWHCPV